MAHAARYLDLAARIVDEAAANWFLADGTYRDPYESGDRWAGGCSARFVCPAAILANRRGRDDLLPLVAEQMDRLCAALAAGRGRTGAGWPVGVFDLVAKEILVALAELHGRVEEARHARWRSSLAAVEPESAYTGTGKLRGGQRLTNYEIYASVGEWLRYRQGLTARTDWLETMLAASQPLFTDLGLYRDPNDPMTYDLSVRQNLAELMHCGYAGKLADTIRGQLERAALATLRMASALGYAPYGGRSNHFVHNEAMLAYVCEFEARRWCLRDAGLAARFRGLAARALDVVARFVELSPPRNLKNRFPPASKFGRDAGYGEYGVYSLLGASLLARTYLVADDAIPVSENWREGASFLHLAPAFHRLFAVAGDTSVQMDMAGQEGYDATGVGRFHRQGVPAPLGGSLAIAAHPKYIVGECAIDRNVAIGPGWVDSGGQRHWLADCGECVLECAVVNQRVAGMAVEWETRHVVEGEPRTVVRQWFRLTPGRLSIRAEVSPPAAETLFMVPCLRTDGEADASLALHGEEATVRFRGATLALRVRGCRNLRLDASLRASREALYRTAEFAVNGARGVLELCLLPGDSTLLPPPPGGLSPVR